MKNKMKKGQIGSEMVMLLWRIFMVVLVVLGIIVIVGTQYEKYDVRQVEAILLSKNTVECASNNGVLADFDSVDLEKCLQIDKEKYFAEASANGKNISAGNQDLNKMCKVMKEGVKVDGGPFCLEQNYIMLEELNRTADWLNVYVAINEEEL